MAARRERSVRGAGRQAVLEFGRWKELLRGGAEIDASIDFAEWRIFGDDFVC
jgi:hypothetical protein